MRALASKKKPPGAGKPGKSVTLVLTDVEGSTELWEWDTDVVSHAIDLHDRIMRAQVTREGCCLCNGARGAFAADTCDGMWDLGEGSM